MGRGWVTDVAGMSVVAGFDRVDDGLAGWIEHDKVGVAGILASQRCLQFLAAGILEWRVSPSRSPVFRSA